jgi:hypothetical protein
MTPSRLFAIAGIFFVAALAWVVLGSSLLARTGTFDDRLSSEVALLWGGPQVQRAPALAWEHERTTVDRVQVPDGRGGTTTQETPRVVVDTVPVPIESSRVNVTLDLEHRQKGLLWYDTYGVAFRGTYRARNQTAATERLAVHLTFPSSQIQFDNFVFRVNGRDVARTDDITKGAVLRTDVPAGGEIVVEVAYDSRGLDTWTYQFVSEGVAEVRDFVLTMTTNFAEVDYPPGSMSPTASRALENGQELTWRFTSLLTGRSIGLDLPNRQNPGPLAARITYFALVSLLFFLTVMVILGVLRSASLHPMHYAFLSAAFFAFHLLLAYLVDHLPIHWSFAIASVVSVFLVTSYLAGVAGPRFAIRQAGFAQAVFLVLFSYAFFFDGYAGLTVTIGAVVTLFILMQATARVDWTSVFARPVPVSKS